MYKLAGVTDTGCTTFDEGFLYGEQFVRKLTDTELRKEVALLTLGGRRSLDDAVNDEPYEYYAGRNHCIREVFNFKGFLEDDDEQVALNEKRADYYGRVAERKARRSK